MGTQLLLESLKSKEYQANWGRSELDMSPNQWRIYPFLLISLVSPGLRQRSQKPGLAQSGRLPGRARGSGVRSRQGICWGLQHWPRRPRGLKPWGKGTCLWNQRTWDPWRLGQSPRALLLSLLPPTAPGHRHSHRKWAGQGIGTPAFWPGEQKRSPRKPPSTMKSMEMEGWENDPGNLFRIAGLTPKQSRWHPNHQSRHSENWPLDGEHVKPISTVLQRLHFWSTVDLWCCDRLRSTA